MWLPVIAALWTQASPASAQTVSEPAPFPFSEAVRADNMLYLSGQIGIAPGEGMLVAGGVAEETRQTMDNIGATLRRHGLGFDDVVRCLVMMTDMAEWSELNRVYASFFPNGRFPARSSMGAKALALGAKVEIECTARFPAASRASNAGTPLGPYSQAVQAEGMVYVSGVIAYDEASGRFAGTGIKEQMQQVFANLDSVLAAAGTSKNRVVKTMMFLRSAEDMPAANAAYAAYFGPGAKPARSTVPGADWGRPEIIVEIEAVAIAGESSRSASE